MSQPKFGQSVSQQGFFSSHDSLHAPCVTRASNPHVATSTASELDLTHKQKQKSRGRLKMMDSGDQPLLGSWNRSTTRGSQDHGNLSSNIQINSGNCCNGTDR